MGTNYYAVFQIKAGEWRNAYIDGISERVHIGKSSSGWCFALRVDNDRGLTSLDAWTEFLRECRIEDEYGSPCTLDELLSLITDRRGRPTRPEPGSEWLERNNAAIGPNGLVRHRIGQYCAAHGQGTWDMMVGEFS
jgi:hypothetical protein